MEYSTGHGIGRGDRQYGGDVPLSHRGGSLMARGARGNSPSRSSGLRASSGNLHDSVEPGIGAEMQIDTLASFIGKVEADEVFELRHVRDRSKVHEGEHATLQRRCKEMESKINNAERTLLTISQNLAQAQQRSAEWERKARVFEGEVERLMTAVDQADQASAQLDTDYSLAKLQLEERDAEERLQKAFAPNTPTQSATQLSDREQDALVSCFQVMSASHPDRVVRPGFGKNGAAIAVRKDSFALNDPKDAVLYYYRVVITPDVVSSTVRKRVLEQLESTQEVVPYLREIARDWTLGLVSRSRLPADFFATISEGSEKVYTVRAVGLKELRSADLNRYLKGEDVNYIPLPIVSAFNLIMTTHASHMGMLGEKAYLFPSSALAEYPLALSAGLGAWKGFSTTAFPAYGNPMVNMDVCAGSFYVQSTRPSDAMIEHQRTLYESSNLQSFYQRVAVVDERARACSWTERKYAQKLAEDVGCTTRPRNPYILFRADFARVHLGVGYEIRGQGGRTSGEDRESGPSVSRQANAAWNEMSVEERQPWIERAEHEKRVYAARYPTYMLPGILPPCSAQRLQ
ncbi:hypothetical protein DFH11DRAFT_1830303 [Phellopilus nigrolimitatus]|nr:hypothetical protein DFH11DRAFT_1830303 [Phellopilus nigrolimitatus]